MKGLEKLKTLDQLVAPKAKKLKVQPSMIKSMYTDQQKFDLLWKQITSKCEKVTYRLDTYVEYYMLNLQEFKSYCLSNYELELTLDMIETYNSYCKMYIEKTLDSLYKNEAFLVNHPYFKVNGEVKNDLSFPERLKSHKFISRCKELDINLESKVLVLNGKQDLDEIEDFIKLQIKPVLQKYHKETYFNDVPKSVWSVMSNPYNPFNVYFLHATNKLRTIGLNLNLSNNLKSDLEHKQSLIKEFWNQFEYTEAYDYENKGYWSLTHSKLFQLGTTIESYKQAFLNFKYYVDEFAKKI